MRTRHSTIKLVRSTDGNFYWSNKGNTVSATCKSEAIAFGSWFLRISREEIQKGINEIVKCPPNRDAFSLFSTAGHYVYTDIMVKKEEDGNDHA
jgi:hypothetical protein